MLISCCILFCNALEWLYVDSGLIGKEFIMVSTILSIALCVALIAGYWKVFTKAGEAGWKSLIPIYNSYVLGNVATKKRGLVIGYVVTTLLAYVAMGIVFGTLFSAAAMASGDLDAPGVSQAVENLLVSGGLSMVVCGIISIINLVVSILLFIRLARAFGKGGGFAAGLIFLQPIFMMILGFSSDIEYEGACED